MKNFPFLWQPNVWPQHQPVRSSLSFFLRWLETRTHSSPFWLNKPFYFYHSKFKVQTTTLPINQFEPEALDQWNKRWMLLISEFSGCYRLPFVGINLIDATISILLSHHWHIIHQLPTPLSLFSVLLPLSLSLRSRASNVESLNWKRAGHHRLSLAKVAQSGKWEEEIESDGSGAELQREPWTWTLPCCSAWGPSNCFHSFTDTSSSHASNHCLWPPLCSSYCRCQWPDPGGFSFSFSLVGSENSCLYPHIFLAANCRFYLGF